MGLLSDTTKDELVAVRLRSDSRMEKSPLAIHREPSVESPGRSRTSILIIRASISASRTAGKTRVNAWIGSRPVLPGDGEREVGGIIIVVSFTDRSPALIVSWRSAGQGT